MADDDRPDRDRRRLSSGDDRDEIESWIAGDGALVLAVVVIVLVVILIWNVATDLL